MDSTAAPRAPRETFPIWATAVIAIVVISFLCFFLGGLALIRAVQEIVKEAGDPKNALVVATNVAQFPSSLPDGYHYKLAIGVNTDKMMSWFGLPTNKASLLTKKDLNLLAIEHEPDKQQIVFLSTPTVFLSGPELEAKDSTELLNDDFSANAISGGTATRFRTRKSKGVFNIAGLSMPYIIGELDDGEPDEAKAKEGLMGCLLLKDQKRVLRIYGLQYESGSYNLPETQTLLESIGKL